MVDFSNRPLMLVPRTVPKALGSDESAMNLRRDCGRATAVSWRSATLLLPGSVSARLSRSPPQQATPHRRMNANRRARAPAV